MRGGVAEDIGQPVIRRPAPADASTSDGSRRPAFPSDESRDIRAANIKQGEVRRHGASLDITQQKLARVSGAPDNRSCRSTEEETPS